MGFGRNRIGAGMWALALLLAYSGQAMGAGPSVDVKVLADVSSVEAGKPFHVAIVITPEAGWHIYWKNPGDSGLPTKVKWEVTDGFQAEELAYPLPEKFVMAGDITAYGYEGETLFLTTIVPAKTLKSGETVSVKGRVSWLCCQEACVPGGQAVELSLPVGEQAVSVNSEVFAKARLAMPMEAQPADAKVTTAVDAMTTADGQVVTVGVSWKQTPAEVDLYPLSVAGLSVTGIEARTEGSATTIHLKARVMAGEELATKEMPALVVYKDGDGQRHGFYIKVDLRGLASASK